MANDHAEMVIGAFSAIASETGDHTEKEVEFAKFILSGEDFVRKAVRGTLDITALSEEESKFLSVLTDRKEELEEFTEARSNDLVTLLKGSQYSEESEENLRQACEYSGADKLEVVVTFSDGTAIPFPKGPELVKSLLEDRVLDRKLEEQELKKLVVTLGNDDGNGNGNGNGNDDGDDNGDDDDDNGDDDDDNGNDNGNDDDDNGNGNDDGNDDDNGNGNDNGNNNGDDTGNDDGENGDSNDDDTGNNDDDGDTDGSYDTDSDTNYDSDSCDFRNTNQDYDEEDTIVITIEGGYLIRSCQRGWTCVVAEKIKGYDNIKDFPKELAIAVTDEYVVLGAKNNVCVRLFGKKHSKGRVRMYYVIGSFRFEHATCLLLKGNGNPSETPVLELFADKPGYYHPEDAELAYIRERYGVGALGSEEATHKDDKYVLETNDLDLCADEIGHYCPKDVEHDACGSEEGASCCLV